MAIGESVFSDSLKKKLLELDVPIPASEVVAAGATGIRTLTPDSAVIRLIQTAYCYAFDITMYFALGSLVIAIPCAAGMQWLNARKIAQSKAAPSQTSPDVGGLP